MKLISFGNKFICWFVLTILMVSQVMGQQESNVWDAIDLLSPTMKGSAGKINTKHVKEPRVKNEGNKKWLVPVLGGAAAAGTAIYFITKDDDGSSSDITAVQDDVEILCATSATINVLDNDSGSGLELISVAPTEDAVFSSSQDGTIIFSGLSGNNFSIEYTVQDENGNTATGTIVATVNISTMEIVDDAFNIEANTTQNLDVLANDSGNGLQIVAVSSSLDQDVAVSLDQTLHYSNDLQEIAIDTLYYTVQDVCNSLQEGMVILQIVPDQSIAANDDFLSTDCFSDLVAEVLSNDIGQGIEVTGFINESNSSMEQNADGTISIIGIENEDFSFQYIIENDFGIADTATVVVEINPSLITTAPDSIQVVGFADVTISPLENDEGSNLQLESHTILAEGGTVIQSGNQIIFTPEENFEGQLNLTYIVANECGNQEEENIVIIIGDLPNIEAVDDVVNSDCELDQLFTVLANDTGENLTVIEVSEVPGLIISTNGVNISIEGATDTDFSVTYTIQDEFGQTDEGVLEVLVDIGILIANDDTFTVNAGETNALSPLDNDEATSSYNITTVTDPTPVGNVAVFGTVLTFQAPEGFSGDITFSYTLDDGCQTATALITVTVIGENPEIEAVNDIAELNCENEITYNVLANDIGVDLSITSIESNIGEVTFDDEGNITIIGLVTGENIITYTIEDSNGNEDEAQFVISVNNTVLLLQDDVYSTPFNTPISISPLLNDSGSSMSIVGILPPDSGAAVTILNDQELFVVPIDGYSGSLMFTYTVEDSCGNTSNAIITVVVQQPNSSLTALNDFYIIPCTPNGTYYITDNDSGEDFEITSAQSDNEDILVTIVDNGLAISLEGNTSSTFIVTYSISDGTNTDFAIVTFNIEIPPLIASTDNYEVPFGESFTFDPLENDIGSNIFIQSFTSSSPGGTLMELETGALMYQPADDFSGTTTFNYTAADDCGQTYISTIIIVIETPPPFMANNDFTVANCTQSIDYNVIANDVGEIDQLLILSISPANEGIEANHIGDGVIEVTGIGDLAISITYIIFDVFGQSSTATFSIQTIQPIISAVNDEYTAPDGSAILITPLDNDIGNDIQMIDFTQPDQGGSVQQGGSNNQLLFFPEADATGNSLFEYTIEDECGQTETAIVVVSIDDCDIQINLQVNDTSCGQDNGSALIVSIAPSGNYSFEWSNGDSGNTTSSLTAGTHFVEITNDESGCTKIQEFIVGNAEADFIIGEFGLPNIVNPLCNGTVGTVSFDVSSTGSGPIVASLYGANDDLLEQGNYEDGDMVTMELPSGGQYEIIIYDMSIGEDCNDVYSFLVGEDINILTYSILESNPPTTNDSNDGSVLFEVENSMGTSYTFSINGTVYMSSNSTILVENLDTDELYTIIVTDDNGCTVGFTVTFDPNAGLANNEGELWKRPRLITVQNELNQFPYITQKMNALQHFNAEQPNYLAHFNTMNVIIEMPVEQQLWLTAEASLLYNNQAVQLGSIVGSLQLPILKNQQFWIGPSLRYLNDEFVRHTTTNNSLAGGFQMQYMANKKESSLLPSISFRLEQQHRTIFSGLTFIW